MRQANDLYAAAVPHISAATLREWQGIVDLIVRFSGARVGLIMHAVGDEIEVCIASQTEGNPYRVGDRECLIGSGLYCERVIATQAPLLVPNALESAEWRDNPDVRLHMIAYLGVPICWPGGQPFGTLCLLDDQENAYSPDVLGLLERMRDLLESQLRRAWESTLHGILDHIPMALACCTLAPALGDARILYVNEAFTRTFGYTREEIPTVQDWALRVYPDANYRHAALDWWAAAIARSDPRQGQVESREFRILAKDGGLRDIDISTVLMPDQLLLSFLDITVRKQREVALAQSEARFRGYFNLPLVGIAINSLDKSWLEVNDRVCAMLGYTRTALAEKTWEELTHPDDRAADIAQFDRVQRGEIDSYSLEKRFIRADGRTIPVDLSVACVRAPDGRPEFFVALLQDISARKEAEQALRESEERFRPAFDNANTGMCLVDLQGRLLQVNPRMTAIFGYSQQELLGMSVNDLALPDDESISPAFIREALENEGYSAIFEKRYRHRDGHLIHGQVASALARDAHGNPLYFISQVQDITERQRTEAALRQEEIFSQAVIDGIPGIFYVFDESGHFLRWNARQRDLILGHLDDERLSQTRVLETVHPEDRDRIGAHFANLFATGNSQTVIGRVLLRGGPDFKWFLLNGQRLMNDDSLYLVGIGIDITDQRKTEERLRESEAQFKALADTSPLAIYLSEDIEQRYEYINPTAVRLFGYTREETPTLAQWWPLAYPEVGYRHAVAQEWQRRIEHAIAMGSAIEPMETVVTCKDGSLKHILWGYQSIGARNYAFAKT